MRKTAELALNVLRIPLAHSAGFTVNVDVLARFPLKMQNARPGEGWLFLWLNQIRTFSHKKLYSPKAAMILLDIGDRSIFCSKYKASLFEPRILYRDPYVED